MKLQPIVLKLRVAETRFNNKIAGAAQLALAMTNTLYEEMAFVIQLSEVASRKEYDSGINQKITERFAIVVALKNDTESTDKTGIIANDLLFTVRAQLWKALLGWQMDEGEESLIYYSGSRLLRIDPSYLWHQYEFEVEMRVDNDDGVDLGETDAFNSIYAQYVLTPDSQIPITGETPKLPASLSDPDWATLIDLTDDDSAGGFATGAFGFGFDLYNKDEKRLG